MNSEPEHSEILKRVREISAAIFGNGTMENLGLMHLISNLVAAVDNLEEGTKNSLEGVRSEMVDKFKSVAAELLLKEERIRILENEKQARKGFIAACIGVSALTGFLLNTLISVFHH